MAYRNSKPRAVSGINLQSFVRTTAAAILLLSRAEVTGNKHNDKYGPMYQQLSQLHSYTSGDDLIKAQPTGTACLTSDDLDCPEFKDTDELLVPTTRTRSLTDDERNHKRWSSSPKINLNKGPDVYESSGNVITPEEDTTPCSSDDEDCLTFSGAEELFFSTADTTVSLVVDSTPTSDFTERTSNTPGVIASSTQSFVPSEASNVWISALPDGRSWILSSKMISNTRLAPINSSIVHYENPSDFNRINFSHRNHLHNYGNDVNNYYYSGNVGRSLEKLTINIGLILGIAFGIAVLLLVLAFALFKYRNQFGSGVVGEKLVDYQTSKCVPLVFEPCKIQTQSTGVHKLQPLKVDVSLNLNHQQQQLQHQPQQLQSASTPRKKDVKEWYV